MALTRYLLQFHRPLPAGFREVEVCDDCGGEDWLTCGHLDAPTSTVAVRLDGKPNTATDNYKLFPERYDAVH